MRDRREAGKGKSFTDGHKDEAKPDLLKLDPVQLGTKRIGQHVIAARDCAGRRVINEVLRRF
jgi:hypothetical protein